MTLKKETRFLFNEIGVWTYHQDNLELVFQPTGILSTAVNSRGRYLEKVIDFASAALPSEPFTPWLWLLSLQQEKMNLATGSDLIDKMIDFLKMLNRAEVFSKPGCMLYRFVLSELYLHPARTVCLYLALHKNWWMTLPRNIRWSYLIQSCRRVC